MVADSCGSIASVLIASPSKPVRAHSAAPAMLVVAPTRAAKPSILNAPRRLPAAFVIACPPLELDALLSLQIDGAGRRRASRVDHHQIDEPRLGRLPGKHSAEGYRANRCAIDEPGVGR